MPCASEALFEISPKLSKNGLKSKIYAVQALRIDAGGGVAL